jgi:hypothetical protein
VSLGKAGEEQGPRVTPQLGNPLGICRSWCSASCPFFSSPWSGLELMLLLPQLSKCWDHMYAPPHPAPSSLLLHPQLAAP